MGKRLGIVDIVAIRSKCRKPQSPVKELAVRFRSN